MGAASALHSDRSAAAGRLVLVARGDTDHRPSRRASRRRRGARPGRRGGPPRRLVPVRVLGRLRRRRRGLGGRSAPDRWRHGRRHGRRGHRPRGGRGARGGGPDCPPPRRRRSPPSRRAGSRRDRASRDPRTREHSWPRRHVASPGTRRRHAAHDLAGRAHLPGRGRTGRSRVRLLGHAALVRRDAEERDHDVRGHVLLPGRRGARGHRCGHPGRHGPARHWLPRPRLRVTGRDAGRRRRVHGNVSRSPHAGSGNGRTLALHDIPRRRARSPAFGDQPRGPVSDPCGRRRKRVRDGDGTDRDGRRGSA